MERSAQHPFRMAADRLQSGARGHYRTPESITFRFTRAILWETEVRKAWTPDIYLPSVVREGSARGWARQVAADGTERFTLASQQRRWLEPARFGLVLERVHLAPARFVRAIARVERTASLSRRASNSD